ncbi:MAG: nucleotidyl transferase AbiEii/AbiGii toxin family protein [Chitinophagaceae bacterium]
MLYWNTVAPLLESVLKDLMQQDEFKNFRLVGGTALSLHLGHRMSIDIDLFTDQEYGTVNFEALENYLSNKYSYFDKSNHGLIGMGCSYLLGNSEEDNLKLDIYYTDPFIQEPHIEEDIRLATVEEIAAMKMDVIQRGGRKKDFWDLHEILESYSIPDLIKLHEQRYPYSHDRAEILLQLTNFENADSEFDPICLKRKVWELIKYEILQAVW